jgi:hypothetical protein
MVLRVVLALIIVATCTGLASAQPGPAPGTYDMEWSILHEPISSDLPDLETGTATIELRTPAPGECPPTSAFIVPNAPVFSPGGTGTTFWCIKPDGSFDTSAGTMGGGGLSQYTNDVFFVKGGNLRGNDTTHAVGRRQVAPPPPPPAATLKVFITQPHNNDTVAGTVWVVQWVEGSSGSSNVFTLSADGKQVGTETTSTQGPVTLPWNSTSVANGTHTLTGTVRDATGNSGTTSITVIVGN